MVAQASWLGLPTCLPPDGQWRSHLSLKCSSTSGLEHRNGPVGSTLTRRSQLRRRPDGGPLSGLCWCAAASPGEHTIPTGTTLLPKSYVRTFLMCPQSKRRPRAWSEKSGTQLRPQPPLSTTALASGSAITFAEQGGSRYSLLRKPLWWAESKTSSECARFGQRRTLATNSRDAIASNG